MHHRPTGPPLSTRIAGAATRTRLRAAAALRRRGSRLGLTVVLVALMTGFVLAVPVVSGVDAPSGVALDSSSAERSDSPVVMGIDGRLGSSAFASASARVTVGPDGVRVEASGRSAAERSRAADAPAAPAPSGPPSTEAPVPAPATVPPAAPSATAEPPAPQPTPAATPSTLAGSSAPTPTAAAGRAEQVLALVNQERAGAGCRALSADGGLAAVATAHSADMRDRGYFDHVNLAGLSPFDRADAAGVAARAENIARGQTDPAAVMESWMNSPGHRANILDCSLTRLGVGIADGGGGPWWTQLFG